MEFSLFFCADGILRTKWSDKPQLLPLKYIQEQSEMNGNDLKFMSRWWDCVTYFEEGLTVATFLEALKPWEKFWGDYIGIDLPAYIKEVRKPYLVTENVEHPITWIKLFYSIDLSPEVEYKRNDKDEDLIDFFNNPKETRLTGDWNLSMHYTLSGYIEGNDEHYSVDGYPINKFANTPLYLDNKQLIHVLDYKIDEILTTENKLFNDKSFGVRNFKPIKEGSFTPNNMQYLQAEKTHCLKDIVEGFFDWFAETPEARDDFNEDLIEKLNKVKIESEKYNESNVVPIYPTKEECTDIQESKKEIKVIVADDAFSSIVEGFNNKEKYWKKMLKNANKNNIINRIGKVKEGTPPEKRLYGYIVEEKDLKTPYIKT